MVPVVATTLAKLLQRDSFTGDDDLIFVSETGGHVDGSALRRRYKLAQTRAKLRPIRFHEYADLFVMPTLPRRFCSGRFFLSRSRHNQSASRKARSVSGGW